MKTAVSLPDELFEAVEKLVKRSKKRRSQVYADALREYVARHAPDEITASYNAVIAEIGEEPEADEFRRAAVRRIMKSTEW
jgi:metal-responsive CopG/Arc/MetJ family transcriptional regulator